MISSKIFFLLQEYWFIFNHISALFLYHKKIIRSQQQITKHDCSKYLCVLTHKTCKVYDLHTWLTKEGHFIEHTVILSTKIISSINYRNKLRRKRPNGVPLISLAVSLLQWHALITGMIIQSKGKKRTRKLRSIKFSAIR